MTRDERLAQLESLVLAIASGDLSARIDDPGDDELAALTMGVMMLAEELASQREQRVRAEAELRATAGRLARSNEELQAFAYAASHDLQEPLRKITAFGGRLEEAQGLDDRHRDYLDRMLRSAERMNELIDGLLALSRVGTELGGASPQQLSEVLAAVTDDLSELIANTGARVELVSDVRVSAHPIQLRQLIQNLLQNAIKFRRAGSSPTIRVTGREQPGLVELEVADDGIGFDPRYAERILRPFERLHGRSSAYSGTGIGLAVCARICSRHDGALSADGTPDGGARFTASFPNSPR